MREKSTSLKVRVAVILLEEEKVLLVKHRKYRRSYWVFPGGIVEKGETLKEAAIRELKEEVNLEIALGEPVFIGEVIPRDGHRHIIDFYFTGKRLRGNLKVSRDKVLQEARFFDIKDLDNLIFYPDIKKELKKSWGKGFQGRLEYLGNRWK